MMGDTLTQSVKRGSLWSNFVTMSFVVAVVMDPLFYYIPIINQDKKCLEKDKTLWTVSLSFRSLLDFIALVHLLYGLHVPFKGVRPRFFFITSVNIDVLALLPIPQLLMGVALYKIRGFGYTSLLRIIYLCFFAQYLPRIYRIYREFKRIKNIVPWFKPMVYIYFYIFSGHVFGALWYFGSILREISCWRSACVKHSTDPKRCIDDFYCDSQTIVSRNITFLNEHCSINIPDCASVPFNFGIYLDALKTGTVGNVKFGSKFFYCFWWGVRNISNFGTNLVTSTYVYENMFAISTSIFSFLLVTLVVATATAPLQVGVKSLPAPVSKQRRIFFMENLKSWNIFGQDLPFDLEIKILSSIDKKLEENEDADLKNDIFSILPAKTREPLQRFLCMGILRTVPVLKMMGTQALEKICDNLKPVTYKENGFIFRMGDPLDCMLFIIKGTVWAYSPTSSNSATSSKMAARLLGKGQFYGEELLNSPDCTQLPISTQHVKTRGKVQAFALMADDWANVVADFNLHWVINNYANNNSGEVEDNIIEIN